MHEEGGKILGDTCDAKWVLFMFYDSFVVRLTSRLAHHRHWRDRRGRLALALVLFSEAVLCR